MKARPLGFIDSSKIDHDGEPFDYICELHEYLWRVVRAMRPGAGGSLQYFLDEEVENLESLMPVLRRALDKLEDM